VQKPLRFGYDRSPILGGDFMEFVEITNPAEIRERLHNEDYWRSLDKPGLLEMAEAALVLYGFELHAEDVPSLGALYRHVVNCADASERLQLILRSTAAAVKHRLSSSLYLPVLVCDPDEGVASRAVIDMVAVSEPRQDGLPDAMTELEPLFRGKGLANPGAVFGGLATLGDALFRSTLEGLKGLLTKEDVRSAARIRTGFTANAQVEFWLTWAEELVNDRSPTAEANFGSVASALAWQARDNKSREVVEVERRYPSYKHQSPIVVIDRWPIGDYALKIAPRLYALEAAETEPRLFSTVLRVWGLIPRYPEDPQFRSN
jgi:hypothetical protein